MSWLASFRDSVQAPNHKTSPIVWFTEDNKYLGGRDDTVAWLKTLISRNDGDSSSSSSTSASFTQQTSSQLVNVDPWNPNHGFEYDLIVIGGGSGGLSCSKEAARLGAKVAVLDYVKPSPHGTKWGLGGTCVNVGCIPKKLMHWGAQLGDFHKTSKHFGWQINEKGLTNDWSILRDNIQDHIKGLNFGYRVQLREQSVTYLNKLGKFINPHTLEVTDAKGKTSTVTAARFVVAVGGRPTPLDIPGGELAITSDDLFSLEKPPGKTCVIGAGYVALECGGFIAGTGQGEVVALVRSRPLRAFDTETVNYIIDHMTKLLPIRIETGVLPKKIEKLANGRLLVTYGGNNDNKTEEFDTVLCAIGRTPDLAGLGLQSLSEEGLPGVKLHEKSGKIVATNEQTTVPHVYAIGDVIHNAPELTPSAIHAGKLLARRLFGQLPPPQPKEGEETPAPQKQQQQQAPFVPEYINYKNIATAVFTPLEMGTVGLTEDEAISQYGKDEIDCYISAFKPLEWSISEEHHDLNAFIKVVFNKSMKNKVIGMHIAAPNAAEVIQGYALAMNKGLTFEVSFENHFSSIVLHLMFFAASYRN